MRIAAAAAHLDILLRLQEERGTGNAGEFPSQSVHYLIGSYLSRTLIWRLKSDEHVAHVCAAAARSAASDECSDCLHRGIFKHHLRQLLLLGRHGGKADVLGAAGAAAEPSGVLLREESLGHDHEQIDVQESAANGDSQRDPLVAQDPAQAQSCIRDGSTGRRFHETR